MSFSYEERRSVCSSSFEAEKFSLSVGVVVGSLTQMFFYFDDVRT